VASDTAGADGGAEEAQAQAQAQNKESTMKVAITSEGTDMSSRLDARFGRAKCFLLVDTETEEFAAVDNAQSLNAVQGAGIQAGRNVIDLGAQAVITGNVGPKAFATLQAAGVEVYIGSEGTVAEALAKFKAGQLQQAGEANVEGHWV
jgi:predicted Fe-Mo cluster-binding NifX family protein